MQNPQQFDPKKSANSCQSSTKARPIPKDMPTVSQLHKVRDPNQPRSKKPFEWRFLQPKFWGIWWAFAIFLPLIYLPLRYQFKIGQKFGELFFTLAKRRQKDTLVNLRLTFPEYSDEQHLQMAKQVFVNASVGIFESLCAWFRPDVFTRTVTVSGLHHVTQAQQQGKTVIVLGAHYTMLDLGGRLASMFIPVDIVYRPQNNPLLEWFIYNARTKIFNDQIAHQDMRKLAKNIKNSHVIWYTPDQDFGLKQGVMADFFGVSCATLTAQRRLAKMGDKQNPPVVLAIHFYRQTPVEMPRHKRPHYHITFTPVLDNYPSHDEIADANRVNELLESLIRTDPTQYMWFHRRFKTQPTGINYYE